MVHERPIREGWPAVTVVGLGGLGSWTALALAKCGFEVSHVYDHDEVEYKNLSNQFYRSEDTGKSKTLATEMALTDFVEHAVVGHGKATANSCFVTGIIVAAVDSLESRRDILAACQASAPVKVLLDLRAGGGTIKLLTCNPGNTESVEWYKTTLTEAPEAMAVCLEQFDAHVGMIAAGLAVRTLQELLLKHGVERLIVLHVPDLHLLQDGPHPWNG